MTIGEAGHTGLSHLERNMVRPNPNPGMPSQRQLRVGEQVRHVLPKCWRAAMFMTPISPA